MFSIFIHSFCFYYFCLPFYHFLFHFFHPFFLFTLFLSSFSLFLLFIIASSSLLSSLPRITTFIHSSVFDHSFIYPLSHHFWQFFLSFFPFYLFCISVVFFSRPNALIFRIFPFSFPHSFLLPCIIHLFFLFFFSFFLFCPSSSLPWLYPPPLPLSAYSVSPSVSSKTVPSFFSSHSFVYPFFPTFTLHCHHTCLTWPPLILLFFLLSFQLCLPPLTPLFLSVSFPVRSS